MKKFILFLLAICLFVFPPLVQAQTLTFETRSVSTGKETVVEVDEVIDRDYFITGETVKFFGTINGDLYAAGGQVIIDGVVNGDLLVAGGQVTIDGKISQDVRAAGGQISINADIGRNLTVAGGSVDVTSSANIFGSLVGAGGNLSLSAPVAGHVNLGVGNLTLASIIGGDVVAGLGTATLTPKAQIAGDFEYWSEEDISMSTGATVAGKLLRKETKIGGLEKEEFEVAKTEFIKGAKKFSGVMKVVGFLATLLVGLLFVTLFPKYSQEAVNTLNKKSLLSLGVGFLTLFFAPLIFLLVFITVIGIPLALILLGLWLIDLYLAKVIVSFWIGSFVLQKLDKKKTSPAVAYILGLLIFSVLASLPFVKPFFVIFSLVFGLGALLLTCKATYSAARKKSIV
ncbi:hypothetical protein ACFLZ1_04980 [Patescibacteria group bacterium]